MDWARCEISAEGLLDQPLDVVTGLCGVIAGIWLIRRDHLFVGAALMVSGVASAAYHAKGGPVTGWLDGVGVALVALAFAADAVRWPQSRFAVAGVAVAGLTAPALLRSGVTGALVVGALVLVLTRERPTRDHLVSAAALFGAGLVAWWAASDTALCSADGWFPLHAVWHTAAILAVTVLVVGRRPSDLV